MSLYSNNRFAVWSLLQVLNQVVAKRKYFLANVTLVVLHFLVHDVDVPVEMRDVAEGSVANVAAVRPQLQVDHADVSLQAGDRLKLETAAAALVLAVVIALLAVRKLLVVVVTSFREKTLTALLAVQPLGFPVNVDRPQVHSQRIHITQTFSAHVARKLFVYNRSSFFLTPCTSTLFFTIFTTGRLFGGSGQL